MSINYDSAKKILSGGYVPEASSMMANALATLALVDEMREARKPAAELNEVHIIHTYSPSTDTLAQVSSVHRDRTKAYAVRDEMNQRAEQLGSPFRYIVNTVGLV